jgi:Ca2+-binding EF-hand superfamily protein
MFNNQIDYRLTKAFNFNDSRRNGHIDQQGFANALRVAGATPLSDQLKSLPATATLSDIRSIAQSAPDNLGLFDASTLANFVAKLSKLLNVSQTGYISPMQLVEILRAGGDGFTLADASDLLEDPKKVFTHPKTGEIDIDRFLRTLIS